MANIAEQLAVAERLLRAGQLDEMDRVCLALLQQSPHTAEAHRFLGLAAFSRNNLSEAERRVRRALELDLKNAPAHDNLSLYLLRLGRAREAEAAARAALGHDPNLAAASHNLGLALRRQGRFGEAESALRQALAREPGNADVWNNLAAVLEQLRRPTEALVALELALRFRPDFTMARENLQRLRAVAVPVPPGYLSQAVAENNRGVELLAQQRPAEAEQAFRRAQLLAPTLPELPFNIAKALQAQQQLGPAEAFYHKALKLRPSWADPYLHLGYLNYLLRRLGQAETFYRRAVELVPDHVEALQSLAANVLNNQGRIDEARECYRRALDRAPKHATCHSNLLLNEQYSSGASLAGLAALHADWENRHAAPLQTTWRPLSNSKDPKRPLRLGFVSSDFFYHPVGIFLAPVLERLERSEFSTTCYSSQHKSDDLTQRLKKAAGLWRDARGVTDEALAEQVRADGIDLLFDLSGHTGGNRLLVFARRPAPVQLTWMAYVGTTGMSAIDYLVADRFQVEPASEHHFREQILRLPNSYLCFEPPVYAPPVGPLPAFAAGHVTFGCFNNTAKITPVAVACWSDILRQVPRSRLIIKYHWLDDESLRQRLTGQFAAEGIAAERLELQGSTSHVNHLHQYNRLDLSLDTFPYSGGLTTCESCWMGVPVITCPGETFASRHALSYLSNIGATETLTRNQAEYKEIAVRLANDLSTLSELRSGLRPRMARSPVCNLNQFTEDFAAACRTVWRAWCESEPEA